MMLSKVKPCNFKNATSSQVFKHEDDKAEHNQLNKQVKLTQSHLLQLELNFTLFQLHGVPEQKKKPGDEIIAKQ